MRGARRKSTQRPPSVTLGAPLSISEETTPGAGALSQDGGGEWRPAAPVAQGEETLRVTVSVTYEIKPKAQ